MRFGKDLFRWAGFIFQAFRLFVGIFGDAEDQEAVQESKDRSANSNPDDVG